jgi:hypothetical protein
MTKGLVANVNVRPTSNEDLLVTIAASGNCYKKIFTGIIGQKERRGHKFAAHIF